VEALRTLKHSQEEVARSLRADLDRIEDEGELRLAALERENALLRERLERLQPTADGRAVSER
jgi:chaperonin cofactor prefoldin